MRRLNLDEPAEFISDNCSRRMLAAPALPDRISLRQRLAERLALGAHSGDERFARLGRPCFVGLFLCLAFARGLGEVAFLEVATLGKVVNRPSKFVRT
ncbi:MAG TPA: hypothetical protein VGH40_20630 [Roseiarcus sp.]